MTTAILCVLLVLGGLFGLLGSIGLVRLRSPMMRLHAPTKATTLGVGCTLGAAVIYGAIRWEPVPHALLIAVFLLVTAPITAMALARLWLRDGAEEIPPPGEGRAWETRDEDDLRG